MFSTYRPMPDRAKPNILGKKHWAAQGKTQIFKAIANASPQTEGKSQNEIQQMPMGTLSQCISSAGKDYWNSLRTMQTRKPRWIIGIELLKQRTGKTSWN
jgi:hypothetical protein